MIVKIIDLKPNKGWNLPPKNHSKAKKKKFKQPWEAIFGQNIKQAKHSPKKLIKLINNYLKK